MKSLLYPVLFISAFSYSVSADQNHMPNKAAKAISHAPIAVMADHLHKQGEYMMSYRYMDMSMDGSPFIDKTHIDGLYFNGGWCYGGFKATPASGFCYAHLLAKDEPHPTATQMRLDRFMTGNLIDEKGMGNQPNLH